MTLTGLFKSLRSARPWSADGALLLVRLGCSLMLLHGGNKLQHFAEWKDGWPDPLHVSPPVSLALTILAEFFCTLLVVAGLWTRLALLPLIVAMLVIVFVIHAPDPFSEREHALLFLFPYLALLLAGPGRFSVDGLLSK